FAFKRSRWVARIVLYTDINRRVVQVVLNRMAVYERKPAHVILAELNIGREVQSPPKRAAGQSFAVGNRINPRNLPEDSGQLYIAPCTDYASTPGQIRKIELRLDVLKFNVICVRPTISCCPWAFQCKRQPCAVTADRHPADLDVPKEHHCVRSPVLQGIWEHIDVHERTPRLTSAKLSQFAIGMS